MTLLIRGDVSPTSLIPAVREVMHSINPETAITTLAPLDQIIRGSLARRRFALELLGVFAALAAILTAIGVYGVISYSLSQRTSEFAIRFALGAERAHVSTLMLRDFAVPTLLGVFGGAWFAYLFAHALQTQLYKLSPSDPLVLAASATALVLLVLGSALRPAMKAASISPNSVPRE
jgi:putative ABC transport system permease protein